LVASSKQSDVEPIHIFWVLYFLKHYPTNEEASHHFGVDTKTYTKWLWRVLFILFIYLNEVKILEFEKSTKLTIFGTDNTLFKTKWRLQKSEYDN
jgi:hypothetical protein